MRLKHNHRSTESRYYCVYGIGSELWFENKKTRRDHNVKKLDAAWKELGYIKKGSLNDKEK
jgi:hypothetical protein